MGDNHASVQADWRARNAEQDRQSQIANTTKAINSVYDAPARQAQYADFVNAVRENYTNDANRQKAIADRNLKFSMARSGLSGGSAAVDANRTLGEEYTKGILGAEDKAQGALGDLKAQDEAARAQLFQLGLAGADATTTASRAGQMASSGLASARADNTAKGLGDIFGSTAATYKAQQDAALKRQQLLAPQGSLYGAK